MLRRDKWWIRELERRDRVHATERAELLSVIAKLAGKPAAAPDYTQPADEPEPPAERGRFTSSPEQFPD